MIKTAIFIALAVMAAIVLGVGVGFQYPVGRDRNATRINSATTPEPTSPNNTPRSQPNQAQGQQGTRVQTNRSTTPLPGGGTRTTTTRVTTINNGSSANGTATSDDQFGDQQDAGTGIPASW